MRFIKYRPASIELRDGWEADANAVLQSLEKEKDPAKRGDIITANSGLWAEVKEQLSKLSDGKCWYTEAKQEGTDTDVDHFRPKKRVNKLVRNKQPHPGYWWLAFKLSNYRFSCIYANRRRKDIETAETGGKADHFPIWEEKRRAWCETDNCDLEEPVLLDPCKVADTKLLMFNANGEAMPRNDKKKEPKKHERAALSIELYNLNHSDFRKARIVLRDQVYDLLEKAEKYYMQLETEGQTAHDAYEDALERLIDLTSAKAPYSRFCWEMIRPKQHSDFLDGVEFG